MSISKILTTLAFSTLLLFACEKSPPYVSKAAEIFPPMQIRQAALFRMDDLGITQDFFNGRWTAVAFASADCPSDCRHRLRMMDGQQNAQALLVLTDLARHDQMRALKADFPGVEISMGATAASLDLFIEQFNDSAISIEERSNYVYLVNPDSQLTHAVLGAQLEPGDLERELVILQRGVE